MNHDSDRCFRLRRTFLYVGVVCTIFFSLAGMGSSSAAFWNVDGSFVRPSQTALVFGVFWACWTALGVWLILTFVRSRLYIGSWGVRRVGCFRVRIVRFDGVSSARWRLTPNQGSLVLRGRDGKLAVCFEEFNLADRREMIELLRNGIDEHIQQGWEPFQTRILAHLIRTLNDGQTPP